MSLRDDVQQQIVEAMSDSTALIDLWDADSPPYAGGIYGIGDLPVDTDAQLLTLRWCSALQAAVLRVAAEVDALNSTTGRG